MNTENGSLDALIQEKLDADTDFQATVVALPEEEREDAINAKKTELIEQEITSLREKADGATKNEELANNYKIRAEKAETELKKLNPEKPTPTKGADDLSTKDLYALMQANVPQEDVDEVAKAAKLLGKSVSEALQDSTVQAILKTREEYRKTAAATNTKNARPGAKGITDEEILSKAAKGEIPAAGSDEAQRLFWARRGGKR